MPVHQFVQDTHLQEKGLANYWGYNTIGFFAPHNAYSSNGTRGQQVQEFKAMVKALHAAGIEVILDVVYNHTAEGNHNGPTLCFRGIDNTAYYRLVDDEPQHYYDTTGTGNSLLMRHPHVLQLIMDSLRYWVLDMHVDGFRFDLAATLARQFHEVDRLSAFFDLVQQDPVISQVKLIAEPWDLGDGGYQVGGFPPLWTEWNGKLPRHRPRLLARRAGHARRVRLAHHRLVRPLPGRRPPPDREHQLRHRPRRFHDAGPGVLQREAQRRQRRGRQRRREPQPVVELRGRGRDRRPGDPQPPAPADAQPDDDAAAQPGRADDRPRRRDRAQPAGQQQRVLPGQRAVLDGLGAGRRGALDARLHAVGREAAPAAPGVPPAPVLRRQRRPRR